MTELGGLSNQPDVPSMPCQDGRPKPLGRLVAFNVLGQAAALAIAFATSVVLARLLGPSDRGLLAIMLLASSLPVALGSFGLPVAMNYFASRNATPPGTILGHSLVYALILAGVFVPVAFLFGPYLADLLAQGRGGDAWVLAGVLVPVTFLSYTTMNHLWGRLAMGFGNLLLITSRGVHLLAVLLIVGVLGGGVSGGLAGSLIAAGLIVVGGMAVLLKDGRPRFHWGTAKAMLRYGSLLQIGTVSLLLNSRLDVLVLQYFRPLDEVGYYVVAATVAEIVILLATAFQGGLLPLLARQEDERRRTTTTAAFVHHGVLALGAIAGVALIGPPLILFAFGQAFHEALIPMLILLPGMWFLGVGIVAAGDLQGRGRPGTASLLALLAAGVTITLDVALIPPLGVRGAALASVAAYAGFGSASLFVLARVAGLSVRRLVVPTRGELSLYPAAVRTVLARIRQWNPTSSAT